MTATVEKQGTRYRVVEDGALIKSDREPIDGGGFDDHESASRVAFAYNAGHTGSDLRSMAVTIQATDRLLSLADLFGSPKALKSQIQEYRDIVDEAHKSVKDMESHRCRLNAQEKELSSREHKLSSEQQDLKDREAKFIESTNQRELELREKENLADQILSKAREKEKETNKSQQRAEKSETEARRKLNEAEKKLAEAESLRSDYSGRIRRIEEAARVQT